MAGDKGEEILDTQIKDIRLLSRLRLELQVLRGAHFEKRGRTYLTELIRCYRSLTDMPQVS